MSTWKKASKVNQKVHRERQQLTQRQHLGFLEKKKDYKRRANNSNENKNIIKKLKKRALDKNPDEFYYHMVNSKVVGGVHRDQRKEIKHTPEQVALMHTRDLKYISARRTMEKKKIDKLKAELHFLDKAEKIPNTHLFFVDSDKEAKNFDLAKHLNTHPSLLHRRFNRPRLEDLEKWPIPEVNEDNSRRMVNQKNKKYNELERRLRREQELGIVQRKLEIKRHLTQASKHNKPKKIMPGSQNSAPVYKWKQERQR